MGSLSQVAEKIGYLSPSLRQLRRSLLLEKRLLFT